ncbi:MAG: NAD(P)/FAD-dependent oxidoreductase [Blastocatellia bacterium]|nr:NAD(P)/FAD-dependent oxidoreductase [Blastocatellia bacterium]
MPIERSFDVVIIGGGPAGMSAAVWCEDLGLSCCVIERSSSLGGQLNWIHAPIRNYPGIEAATGNDLLERFRTSLPKTTTYLFNEAVESLIQVDLAVSLVSGERIKSKAIVLATGIRRRKLGVSGEEEFKGLGILDSGAKAKNEVSGKNVVIIGGGDAALENASMLSETASKVMVIHRRASLAARAEFLATVAIRPNVELLMSAKVVSINGDDKVRSVSYQNEDAQNESLIDADAVLIRIGVEPNSEIVKAIVDLDARGYVVVDRECMTSVPDIYAIGDVSNQIAPTIASAVGDAATAIKSIRSRVSTGK